MATSSPKPPSRLKPELQGAEPSPGLSCGRQQPQHGAGPLVQPHPAPPRAATTEEGQLQAQDQALDGVRGSGDGSWSYWGAALCSPLPPVQRDAASRPPDPRPPGKHPFVPRALRPRCAAMMVLAEIFFMQINPY